MFAKALFRLSLKSHYRNVTDLFGKLNVKSFSGGGAQAKLVLYMMEGAGHV